ncbi:Sensor protein ZraS [Novipirellula galeiformis]|uniref:histidine kinase n=1 Tax=Novipirellula galeiformis TaxID=2528004 RepID=A0A5C6C6L7_9BACT|nr:ATP-binding protein [Novipirellula galeiformis]TWU20280.1 Sensor protein ZraS [Novipirellula galeiformis]
MKLRNKLGVFLSVSGFALLCLGFSGAWYVLELQRQNSQLLDVNVASIRAAEELELLVHEMRHELGMFSLTHEPAHLDVAVEQERDVNQWLSQATALSATTEERTVLAELRGGLQDYFIQLHQLVDDRTTPISSTDIEQLRGAILSDHVLQRAHHYLKLNENELEQSNLQNQSLAHKLALVMVLLGACGAVVGLEAGYGVSRAINRSMFMLSVPIRDVVGKLDMVVGPVEVSADPSLQDLQIVLETVASRVATVVEQLQVKQHEVIRADQLAAVGQLAAGLAHELRNPLMCMKTLVQSARRDPPSTNLNATDLAILDEEITRLDNLLQTFLDFARPAELESKPVELAAIVRQTMGLVASRAETRHIQLDTQLPNESMVVQGDASQLRQVLLNLLLNAFDAVPNGGEISVIVERQGIDSDNEASPAGRPEWVCLSVIDNGCGLPMEQLERIFEPFFSTKDPGVGLGLAVSRRIIDAHEGQLLAEARSGGGTEFKVRLPLAVGTALPHLT